MAPSYKFKHTLSQSYTFKHNLGVWGEVKLISTPSFTYNIYRYSYTILQLFEFRFSFGTRQNLPNIFIISKFELIQNKNIYLLYINRLWFQHSLIWDRFTKPYGTLYQNDLFTIDYYLNLNDRIKVCVEVLSAVVK